MLKRLLGNWKAHKRRPSLLPGDGDIHFENPSSLNPLYEDSDESASSQKQASEQPSSFSNNEDSLNAQISADSIDVEPLVSHVEEVSKNASAADSANNQTIAVPELQHKTEKSESETFSDKGNNLTSLKDITNLENESFLHKFGSGRQLIKNDVKLHESVKQESGIVGSNITAISIETSADTHTEVKEKLPTSENQVSEFQALTENVVESSIKASEREVPSTSKVETNQTLSHEELLTNAVKAPNSSPTSKPKVKYKPQPAENAIEDNIIVLDHKLPSASKVAEHETVNRADVLTEALETPNSSSTPGPQTKHKARAIDDLIKKFQNSEIFNREHLQKSASNLTRTNATQAQQSASKDTKVKIQSYKDSKEPIIATSKPEVKPNLKFEKESLENIFNIPPPPPIESLNGKKTISNQFHNRGEKLKTDTKSKLVKADEPSSSNGLTKSDSSLERNVVVSAHRTDNNIVSSERGNLKEQQVLTKSEGAGSQYPQQGGLFTPHLKRENGSVRNKASVPVKENINSPSGNTHSSPVPNVQKETEEVQSTSSVKVLDESYRETQQGSEPSHSKTELNASNGNNSISAENKPSNLLPKLSASLKETDLPKSHSEDSGITRGDQISSEMASDLPAENQGTGDLSSPLYLKRSRKQRDSKRNRNSRCNHCKHSLLEDPALKKVQGDAYYDILTGYLPSHRMRHSDSWTSDLSWEDRELLKKLRRKKTSSGSNATSMRSRHSRRRSMRDSPFHRSHRSRRSLSDESSFYGSSACSCDECWSQKVKHFANSRTSLRGIPPIQEVCTCRSLKPEVFGRRVQFLSETIPEMPLLEKISTPSTTGKNEDQEDAVDETNSHTSAKSKEDQTRKTQDKTEINSKILEEGYRFLTPWEFEEWNLAMRRHSLKRRRNRARCMGLIALALVVFVGLIVTILMLYLRKRIL